MNKLKKILLAVIVGVLLSATSAFAVNKSSNKSGDKTLIISENQGKSIDNAKSNQSPCSSCPGCNGNCILKK